jgi:hypothetical protein
MRAMLSVPLAVILFAAISFAICKLLGWNAHGSDLIAAGFTCLVAGELAGIPLILARGGNTLAISQAALVGSVIHLLASIVIAGIAVMLKLHVGQAYLFWMLGFYWITLLVLVIGFAKAIRSAPATAPRS